MLKKAKPKTKKPNGLARHEIDDNETRRALRQVIRRERTLTRLAKQIQRERATSSAALDGLAAWLAKLPRLTPFPTAQPKPAERQGAIV